jgi:DNA (cytosine-5)-methyltransferase 1
VKYGSVCSGIEAATAAWHGLGWRPSFFSEIDKFPRAVLSAHYPKVPLHGDFTTIRAGEYDPIDVLVGGTPCQSFSVAGLRGGLADGRGNLALEYLKLAQRLRPKWLVWENVPGVLSSAGGRDFGSILGGLVELGYGFAYRVLDAQFFGVPQRRRRVFVVGYLGDWRRAAAVLFERDCLSGHPAPRREAGQRAAPTISARTEGGGRLGTDFDLDGGLIRWPAEVAPTLNAAFGDKQGLEDQHALNGGGLFVPSQRCGFDVAHTLRGEGYDASEDGTGRGTPLVPVAFSSKDHGADAGDLSPTLRAMGSNKDHPNGGGQIAIAFNARQDPTHGPVADPIGTKDTGHGFLRGSAVRRLTPRECERLQGFPDDYTLIQHRGKPAADGPRYKALGNSMAVPVMRWIGERIQMVETLTAGASA